MVIKSEDKYITATKLKGIPHFFFTKNILPSTHKYIDLEGKDFTNIIQNRQTIAEFYDLSHKELCILRQIHSNKVIMVENNWGVGEEPLADSMITKTPNLILAIQTADCVPILLADISHKIVGAIHAGWRGARSGIIEKTIEAMLALGAIPNNIIAVIGPTINQSNYEVGEEFYEDFFAEDESNSKFFMAGGVRGKYYFDLKAYVFDKLQAYGVEVEDLQYDTYSHESKFFSYRRFMSSGGELDGRQLATIALKE